MSKKPLTISLVIPVYNEESYLVACLEAARGQTMPFHEIIVVDNNSTDRSCDIVAHHPEVKLVHETRQGIVHARSRGFDAAKGDIIARIDADTTLPAGWAAHIAEFYADPQHLGTAWTSSGLFRDVPVPRLVSGGYRLVAVHINRLLTGYPALWGSSMALPRKAWHHVASTTCTGSGFHEDLDLAHHLHHSGYRIFWDKSIRVSASLRHAWITKRELWEYLQWWPRTLRRHGQKTWVLCWLGGSFAMFGATLALAGWQRQRHRQLLLAKKAQVPSAFEV